MNRIIALVFHYAVNGLLAVEGTEYYRFCFEVLDEVGGASDDDATLDLLRGASAHLMGRSAYEGMSGSLPTATDHPWAPILNTAQAVGTVVGRGNLYVGNTRHIADLGVNTAYPLASNAPNTFSAPQTFGAGAIVAGANGSAAFLRVRNGGNRSSYTLYSADAATNGFDGFGLALKTEPMEPAGETERSPLYRLCGSEAGEHECGEHEDGKVVVADLSTASTPALEARTEFTDGTAAYLMTKLPTGKDDLPSIEFPDIDGTDMADLAGHVRPAEAGEAEEVVSAVMD